MPKHFPYYFGKDAQTTCLLFARDELRLTVKLHNIMVLHTTPYILALEKNNKVIPSHEIFLSVNGFRKLKNSAESGPENLSDTLETMGISTTMIAAVIRNKLEMDASDIEMAQSAFARKPR